VLIEQLTTLYSLLQVIQADVIICSTWGKGERREGGREEGGERRGGEAGWGGGKESLIKDDCF